MEDTLTTPAVAKEFREILSADGFISLSEEHSDNGRINLKFLVRETVELVHEFTVSQSKMIDLFQNAESKNLSIAEIEYRLNKTQKAVFTEIGKINSAFRSSFQVEGKFQFNLIVKDLEAGYMINPTFKFK